MYFATKQKTQTKNINRTTVNEMEFNVEEWGEKDCLQHTFAHEGNALKEFSSLLFLYFCSPHKIRSLLSENCVFCKLL